MPRRIPKDYLKKYNKHKAAYGKNSERSCDVQASLFCADVRSVKNKIVRIAALKLYLQC